MCVCVCLRTDSAVEFSIASTKIRSQHRGAAEGAVGERTRQDLITPLWKVKERERERTISITLLSRQYSNAD